MQNGGRIAGWTARKVEITTIEIAGLCKPPERLPLRRSAF